MARAHRVRAYRSGVALGYTLVELLLVIVILGILGAVAGPRMVDSSAFEQRAFLDEVASGLRYGQKVAVASGCAVRVTLSASTYALQQQANSGGHCDSADSTFATPLRLPSSEPVQGTAPDGLSIAPATVFEFLPSGETSLVSDLDVSVGSRVISIQAGSGSVFLP